MKPIEKIELNINYEEDYQFIDELHEIDLDNGYSVIFNFSAEVYIKHDRRDFYDEPQVEVKVEDQIVEIIEVYDGDDLIELSPAQEKELKTEILSYIQ